MSSSDAIESNHADAMTDTPGNRVVYLELHTSDLPRACGFFAGLFGWRTEIIRFGGQSYMALDLGGRIEGGVVERDTERSVWLPYIDVDDVAGTTERARRLGASVVLGPREGPAGWRSVLVMPAGGDIALWQPKR